MIKPDTYIRKRDGAEVVIHAQIDGVRQDTTVDGWTGYRPIAQLQKEIDSRELVLKEATDD